MSLCNNGTITYFSLLYGILKYFHFVRRISHMWTLVHSLDIRWITETIQDILWLLRYAKMTFVGHPWDKVLWFILSSLICSYIKYVQCIMKMVKSKIAIAKWHEMLSLTVRFPLLIYTCNINLVPIEAEL